MSDLLIITTHVDGLQSDARRTDLKVFNCQCQLERLSALNRISVSDICRTQTRVVCASGSVDEISRGDWDQAEAEVEPHALNFHLISDFCQPRNTVVLADPGLARIIPECPTILPIHKHRAIF